MPDLRETLAERLRKSGGGDPPTDSFDREILLAMADECIRQMHWVRACDLKGEHWVKDDIEPGRKRLVDALELPLTAAPDDWEVPK